MAAWQSSVSANTMNIQITGKVTSHSPNNGFWDGTVMDGVTPYTFSLQFDSNAIDANSDPTIGNYVSSGAPFQCSITFGDYTFTTTGTFVNVYNDALFGGPPTDAFVFGNQNTFTQNGLTLMAGGVQTDFFFSNNSFLNSDSLSEVKTYPLADFSQAYLFLSGTYNTNQQAQIGGNVDSFVVSTIPEPSTWAMLGVGAVLLLGGQRLRRPRARR